MIHIAAPLATQIAAIDEMLADGRVTTNRQHESARRLLDGLYSAGIAPEKAAFEYDGSWICMAVVRLRLGCDVDRDGAFSVDYVPDPRVGESHNWRFAAHRLDDAIALLSTKWELCRYP
jgi:hypothetical protein